MPWNNTAILKFQSTPSAWRETYAGSPAADRGAISIHSLRMEGDRLHLFGDKDSDAFQSTPSAWRETLR